jgi:hypothetical protein
MGFTSILSQLHKTNNDNNTVMPTCTEAQINLGNLQLTGHTKCSKHKLVKKYESKGTGI